MLQCQIFRVFRGKPLKKKKPLQIISCNQSALFYFFFFTINQRKFILAGRYTEVQRTGRVDGIKNEPKGNPFPEKNHCETLDFLTTKTSSSRLTQYFLTYRYAERGAIPPGRRLRGSRFASIIGSSLWIDLNSFNKIKVFRDGYRKN